MLPCARSDLRHSMRARENVEKVQDDFLLRRQWLATMQVLSRESFPIYS